MTELAYLADIDAAYVREFRARVVALPPHGVVLDRTFFYPTGGGQPCDRGTIDAGALGTFEVVDVSKSGSAVVHRVKPARGASGHPAVGAEVAGSLDWSRRHLHMRLHTAQHLLSARIFLRTGRRTRKATMSGRRAILEVDGPLDPAGVARWTDDLGAAVAEPKPVTVRFVARAEWDRHPASARSGLVPLPAQVDPVRVIEIEGLDVCPCGGTHLRTTAEIGPATIAPPEPLGDGGTRVSLELGERSPPPPDAPRA